MKINLLIFLTSLKKQQETNSQLIMKTFESTFRPVKGDIIDDPGFDSRFHNGYEVAKERSTMKQMNAMYRYIHL